MHAQHSEEDWQLSVLGKALQMVQSTDVPASISDDEHKLLLLLEGQIEESVNKLKLTEKLPKKRSSPSIKSLCALFWGPILWMRNISNRRIPWKNKQNGRSIADNRVKTSSQQCPAIVGAWR